MPVVGVGGIFFRARDPEALAAWYAEHLGIGPGLAPEGVEPDDASWTALGGQLVFQPFPADADHWPADQPFMLNLRVTDLAGLTAALTAAGVEVTGEGEMAGVGRFARVHDPEGHPLELWEPAVTPG